jgi:hypothetical protein
MAPTRWYRPWVPSPWEATHAQRAAPGGVNYAITELDARTR